jgi:hypothetical protein
MVVAGEVLVITTMDDERKRTNPVSAVTTCPNGGRSSLFCTVLFSSAIINQTCPIQARVRTPLPATPACARHIVIQVKTFFPSLPTAALYGQLQLQMAQLCVQRVCVRARVCLCVSVYKRVPHVLCACDVVLVVTHKWKQVESVSLVD